MTVESFVVNLGTSLIFHFPKMCVKKIAAAIVVQIMRKQKRQKVKRHCWVKSWILLKPELGACASVARKLEIEDAKQFRDFVRINTVQMQHIIKEQDT